MARFPFLVRRRTAEQRRHLKGLVRAGAYLVALGLVFGVLQVRAARAEVEDRTVQLGRQMVDLAKSTDDDIHRIMMNGQAMFVGSSVSKDAPKNILDRYETYCDKNAAQPGAAWRDLAGKLDAEVEKRFIRTGVLRGGDDKEGTVVCFTKNPASKPTLGEAVKAFGETGNLGALGSMRYVYAKKTERGQTLVLTAWTDDSFSIFDLVPAEGRDVKGEDLDGIPRPPRTDRVLSTRVEGTPFGINAYRGKDAPSAVIGFYDKAMFDRGWRAIDPELPPDGHDSIARLYERDGVVLTLGARVDEGATFSYLGLAGVTAQQRP
jgi:hypothetical protein